MLTSVQPTRTLFSKGEVSLMRESTVLSRSKHSPSEPSGAWTSLVSGSAGARQEDSLDSSEGRAAAGVSPSGINSPSYIF